MSLPTTRPNPHASTPQCDRFFFAIRPDAQTARAIDVFAAHAIPEGRRLPIAHQHVTLAITADYEAYPDEIVARLCRAGAEVAADPFDITLDRLSAGRRTAALCPGHAPAGLLALQGSIVAAMTRHELPMRKGWRFSPHQTLCYRTGEPFSRRIDGFTWTARELVLVHSLVGLTRHETIGCWPLRGDQPMFEGL